MLIHKSDKSFVSRSDKPNSNWLNDDNYFVVEDGSELYNKIVNCDGEFNLIVQDGVLIDIEPLIPEVNQDEINVDLDFRLSCIELGL